MNAHWDFCLRRPAKILSLGLIAVGLTLIAAYPAKATDFTLSDPAIMSLDYDMSNFFLPPPTASIVSKRDILGSGVEFDIHYPSTNSPDYYLYWVSDEHNGAGTLAGTYVSAYSNYDLKFTLVSIDGSTSGSGSLVVGALIGLTSAGTYYQYRPKVIGLAGINPASDVSSTSIGMPTIYVIGFTARLFGGGWSASPHDVTLLVQPAPGAVVIPEPATWVLLALGGGALLVGHRLCCPRRSPLNVTVGT